MKRRTKIVRTCLCGTVIFLVSFLFSEPSAAEKAVNMVDKSSNAGAARVERLLDEGKLEQAKKLLDERLKSDPKSAALRYQLSRFYLVNGFAKDETIIGYHYKDATTEQTTSLLNEIIETDPSFGKAYSLLGLIYAVQNNLDKAREFLQQAERLKQPILWLTFNQAVLSIKEKDYSTATELLEPITNKRPSPSNTAENNRYRSAWKLRRRLAVRQPQYDPNDAIRNGLIKRVLADQIAEYIANDKSKKPMFVHIASDDKWCPYCIKNNRIIEKLAKKYRSRLDFVNVSFEPWNDINFQRDLIEKYAITGVPANYIFYSGKLISAYPGQLRENVANLFVTDAVENVKAGNFDRYTEAGDGKTNALLSYPFKVLVWRYLSKKDYKALAVTFNDMGIWWSNWADHKNNQKAASKEALDKCNRTKVKKRLTQACVLYAEGDKIVYNGTNEKVLNVLKNDLVELEARLVK